MTGGFFVVKIMGSTERPIVLMRLGVVIRH